MYRAFESLDELVEIVETARGLPMSGSCVVSRSHSLDLLDDIREAYPEELVDANDVLAQRDEILAEARQIAEHEVTRARDDATHAIASAQDEADRTLVGARKEGERIVRAARAEAEEVTTAARERYDEHVAAAEDEHHRLVSETTVHQSAVVVAEQIHAGARAEADEIRGHAHADAEAMRREVEDFVDQRLAAFEDMLRSTLRTIGGGRDHLHGRSTPATPGHRR